MRRILCILTAPGDPVGQAIISAEEALPNTAVRIIDLKEAEPDYAALLDAILDSDSVQVW